jgi:hypothetical protein
MAGGQDQMTTPDRDAENPGAAVVAPCAWRYWTPQAT